MKIAILYKIIKSGNMLFGQHQVLETGAQQQQQQQQAALAPTSFTETKWDFLVKLVIFAQQDAIKVNQPQQQ